MSKSSKNSSSEIKDLKDKKEKLDLQKVVVEAEAALATEQKKKVEAEAEAETAATSAELKKKQEIAEAEKKAIEAEVALAAEKKKKADTEIEAARATTSAELKRKQEFADAEKKLSETKNAILKAKLPKTTVEKLSGTITTDDKFGYVAEIAAYQAMFRNVIELEDKIRKDIKPSEARDTEEVVKSDEKAEGSSGVTDIPEDIDVPEASKERNKTSVLIVNDLQFAGGDSILLQLDKSMELWSSFLEDQKSNNDKHAKDIEKLLFDDVSGVVGISNFDLDTSKNLFSASISNVPEIAESLLGSAASLAGFFQADYGVSGQEIDIAREAIVNELAGKITDLNPVIMDFHLLESSTAIETFSSLLTKRKELLNSQVKLNTIAIDKLKLKIEQETDNLPEASDNEEEQKVLIEILENLQIKKDKLKEALAADQITTTLVSEFDKFTESITQKGEDGTSSVLARTVQREFISSGNFSYLLWINPISSGGEAITVKKLWRSGRVSYIGGGVISYVLAKTDGTIVSSGNTLGLSQISHILASNKDYQLKHVKLDSEYRKKCFETIRGWFSCNW